MARTMGGALFLLAGIYAIRFSRRLAEDQFVGMVFALGGFAMMIEGLATMIGLTR